MTPPSRREGRHPFMQGVSVTFRADINQCVARPRYLAGPCSFPIMNGAFIPNTTGARYRPVHLCPRTWLPPRGSTYVATSTPSTSRTTPNSTNGAPACWGSLPGTRAGIFEPIATHPWLRDQASGRVGFKNLQTLALLTPFFSAFRLYSDAAGVSPPGLWQEDTKPASPCFWKFLYALMPRNWSSDATLFRLISSVSWKGNHPRRPLRA